MKQEQRVLSNKRELKWVSSNIKYLRESAGMTQKDLAGSLGFQAASVVNAWEKGSKEPSILSLINIARQFGISADSILQENLKDKRRKALRSIAREPITIEYDGIKLECCPHCKRSLEGSNDGRFCKYCGQEIEGRINYGIDIPSVTYD